MAKIEVWAQMFFSSTSELVVDMSDMKSETRSVNSI